MLAQPFLSFRSLLDMTNARMIGIGLRCSPPAIAPSGCAQSVRNIASVKFAACMYASSFKDAVGLIMVKHEIETSASYTPPDEPDRSLRAA